MKEVQTEITISLTMKMKMSAKKFITHLPKSRLKCENTNFFNHMIPCSILRFRSKKANTATCMYLPICFWLTVISNG